MKNPFKWGLFATMSLFISCSGANFLDTDISEGGTALSGPEEQVEIPSASFFAEEKILDETGFRANYNWKAEVSESWIELLNDSDINLSGVSKTYVIPFFAEDNPAALPRTATLEIKSGEKTLKIEIIQKAFEPVISIESPSVISVPCEGGEYTAVISSNTTWEASVAPGSTADVNLLLSHGVKSGEILIKVGSNLDEDEGKSATIVISADGCDDLTITINQAKYKA